MTVGSDLDSALAAVANAAAVAQASANAAGAAAAALQMQVNDLQRRVSALETGPTPPPVPVPLSGPYGSGNGDTKANLQVGWTNNARLSHRFRAGTSSPVATVRFCQRGGSGYSGGTGGTMRVSLQGDKNGAPDGNVLGSATYGPKNPAGGIFDYVTIVGAAPLQKGTLYHVVYENTDAKPQTNYISVNHLFVYNAITPRQPLYPDMDLAVLYDSGSGFVVQGKYTPVVDVAYTDGHHDGFGYVGMVGIKGQAVYASPISGTAMCREVFTPKADLSFTTCAVRIRRTTGTSPLTVSLDGTSLGTILAKDVPLTQSGGDNGGSVWATVSWVGALTLRAGTQYALQLSCPSDTTYTAAVLRAGTDSGFSPTLCFDGVAQETADGKTWVDPYSGGILDYQVVFA